MEEISNENIVIADSRLNKPEERIFKEKFTLKDIHYDKTEEYYLVMEEEGTKDIYEKIPFSIGIVS